MRKLLLLLAVLTLAGPPAGAVSLYIVPDVPTDLAGTTYLPSDVVRYDAGVYTLGLALPTGTPVDALHRLLGGDWLFSVEAPTDLGGNTYQSSDVIRFDGVNYSSLFCGGPVGVPAGSDVDAIVLKDDNPARLAVSFDVQTTIGGNTYDPADLVDFTRTGAGCNGWTVGSVSFDGSSTIPPVPVEDNVVAADYRSPKHILAFDVPATLGATYRRGDLVSWDGVSFALYEPLAGWPAASLVYALTFPSDPGKIAYPPNAPLTANRVTATTIQLTWGPSCSVGAENYGIYEGVIGSWYSHTQIDCDDGGSNLTELVTTGAGNRYYLVVPFNPNDEGSYGQNSAGAQRPVGTVACLASQSPTACP